MCVVVCAHACMHVCVHVHAQWSTSDYHLNVYSAASLEFLMHTELVQIIPTMFIVQCTHLFG